MLRKAKFLLLLSGLAALAVLSACAPRDPNLALHGLSEFGRSAGDYTLRVNLYQLDDKGLPQLVSAADPSLTGFVTRTLAARGYTFKTSGPARYHIEVHLLCGNMRTADMSLMAEALTVPESAIGSGYDEHIYSWLPDRHADANNRETSELRDSMHKRQGPRIMGYSSQTDRGGAPLGRVEPDYCQGRVLVVLTPASAGPMRDVYVAHASTDDCKAVAGCPADVCRSSLEISLVDLLESRF